MAEQKVERQIAGSCHDARVPGDERRKYKKVIPKCMKKKVFALSAVFLMIILSFEGCAKRESSIEQEISREGLTPDERFSKFLTEHVERIKPLWREASLSLWNAYETGSDGDYEKYAELSLELTEIYSNKNDFQFISKIKGELTDPLLRRQAELLYLSYLPNQADPELLEKIIRKETELEQKFNTFRGKINGREVSMNDIREILKKETDSEIRKAAWEAQKQVGETVAPGLIELVRLRNQVARELGFDNYFEMSLETQEQNEEELTELFAELEKLTDAPFKKLKSHMDDQLKRKFGVNKIMPWHYSDPFFQEVPKYYEFDFDKMYEHADVFNTCTRFYHSMGLDIDDILAQSSLYEKQGKYPHACTMTIDPEAKDIRLMLNLKNDSYWMGTILHEAGHGSYQKYVNSELPFLLQGPSHILTTEAVAMLIERMPYYPDWVEEAVGEKLSSREKKVLGEIFTAKELIFSRWGLVMFNFEKGLYENPDQDLNKLWWNLKQKYQFVEPLSGRDKPDYAAKIHLISSPVYYHNYVLGDLFASQLHHCISVYLPKREESYYGHPEVGEYLKEWVFAPGARYSWQELIKHATGEELNPEYFRNQFCR